MRQPPRRSKQAGRHQVSSTQAPDQSRWGLPAGATSSIGGEQDSERPLRWEWRACCFRFGGFSGCASASLQCRRVQPWPRAAPCSAGCSPAPPCRQAVCRSTSAVGVIDAAAVKEETHRDSELHGKEGDDDWVVWRRAPGRSWRRSSAAELARHDQNTRIPTRRGRRRVTCIRHRTTPDWPGLLIEPRADVSAPTCSPWLCVRVPSPMASVIVAAASARSSVG